MFLETPRFPDELAYGARGGPQYSTSVVGTFDGTETRNQNWSQPLARYEIGLVHRERALTELLFAFFRTIAQGRTNSFRFHDPLPGEGEGIFEYLDAGDGVRRGFQLRKRYGSGDLHAYRTITKPVPGTVVMYLNDTTPVTTGWSVDTATGMVYFDAPVAPGSAVLADFQFDVPVRFDTDQLGMQRVTANLWSWESILLIETRPGS
jgi:uncharacterized protein (TIGR02217 family)